MEINYPRHSTLQVAFILRLHPEPSDGLMDFTLLSESSEKCGKGEIRTLNLSKVALASYNTTAVFTLPVGVRSVLIAHSILALDFNPMNFAKIARLSEL